MCVFRRGVAAGRVGERCGEQHKEDRIISVRVARSLCCCRFNPGDEGCSDAEKRHARDQQREEVPPSERRIRARDQTLSQRSHRRFQWQAMAHA